MAEGGERRTHCKEKDNGEKGSVEKERGEEGRGRGRGEEGRKRIGRRGV